MKPNLIEKGPERIPTREEVMEVISRFEKDVVFVRELSDELGIYLLEAKGVDSDGDKIEFFYHRKRDYPGGHNSPVTRIENVRYVGEDAVSGVNLTQFNYETGEWEEIK